MPPSLVARLTLPIRCLPTELPPVRTGGGGLDSSYFVAT